MQATWRLLVSGLDFLAPFFPVLSVCHSFILSQETSKIQNRHCTLNSTLDCLLSAHDCQSGNTTDLAPLSISRLFYHAPLPTLPCHWRILLLVHASHSLKHSYGFAGRSRTVVQLCRRKYFSKSGNGPNCTVRIKITTKCYYLSLN